MPGHGTRFRQIYPIFQFSKNQEKSEKKSTGSGLGKNNTSGSEVYNPVNQKTQKNYFVFLLGKIWQNCLA
jgi:hypothetical protein